MPSPKSAIHPSAPAGCCGGPWRWWWRWWSWYWLWWWCDVAFGSSSTFWRMMAAYHSRQACQIGVVGRPYLAGVPLSADLPKAGGGGRAPAARGHDSGEGAEEAEEAEEGSAVGAGLGKGGGAEGRPGRRVWVDHVRGGEGEDAVGGREGVRA
eukprot:6124973-Prymnesium_polylepis.1